MAFWLILLMGLMVAELSVRYVQYKHAPRAWTMRAALTGMIVWLAAGVFIFRADPVRGLLYGALFAIPYFVIFRLLSQRVMRRMRELPEPRQP